MGKITCTLLGLATGDVSVGGNTGPETHSPHPEYGQGLVVFRMSETNPGDVMAMASQMEALANGHSALQGDDFDHAARIGRKITEYLRNDGKLDGGEVADLLAALADAAHVDDLAKSAAEGLLAKLRGLMGGK